MKKYRLGIDLGATSLGWSVLGLDKDNSPKDLIDIGVRIFPDGRDAKTNEPLNVQRREHRSSRRNRDRYLQRRAYLMDTLVIYGLMPKNEDDRKQLEYLDPYFLRAKALDEEISLFELGRAIFHLNQRRGFKSNRKLDSAEKETSRMKDAIKELKQKLDDADARTLGEYLYNLNNDVPENQQHKKRPARIRDFGKDYNFYTDREMYSDEFDMIWEKQSKYHDELIEKKKEYIKRIIFSQRDLKPQPKGKCRFEINEFRAPVAFPIVQQFRIYQEVNNLILLDFDRKEHKLTNEQKDIIITTLLKQKTAAFKSLKKKIVKDNPEEFVFNLESEKRKDLKGDETSYIMRKDEHFWKIWDDLSESEQDEIIRRIINEDNVVEIETTLSTWLQENFDVTEEQALHIKNVRLPQGISSLSIKAIKNILPYLKEGYIYSDACAKAGYHHSDFRTGDVYDECDLPYYGEVMPGHVAFGSNDPDDVEKLARFGKYFGNAYQIRDDIIDAFTPNDSDHSPNNDLLNGDPSLLLLYAVNSEIIQEEDKTRILSVYHGETTDLDIEFICRIYEETGALKKSVEKMEEYALLAGDILKDYPDCDAKESLIELLDQYNHDFSDNLGILPVKFIEAQ